jgi:hypothetical protein
LLNTFLEIWGGGRGRGRRGRRGRRGEGRRGGAEEGRGAT